MKRMRKCRRWLGTVLILCGIIAVLLPELWSAKTQEAQNTIIENFPDMRQEYRDQTELWEQISHYNELIYKNHQVNFNNERTVKEIPEQLTMLDGSLFGYIEIPVMQCKLPLYLGASDENMAMGAAVLGGTSVPIGGINTNSVIAGHRGWKNGKYFKDIEKLTVGDHVYITNPWETLCYCVEKVVVIEPSDSEKVKIQEGKDMITLLTCHPYRSGGRYRYVVYCTRAVSEKDPA